MVETEFVAVSIVSLVPVVSFRWFLFGVLGYSTRRSESN